MTVARGAPSLVLVLLLACSTGSPATEGPRHVDAGADASPTACSGICQGACTDLTKDPLHCGACERACSAGDRCVDSTCHGDDVVALAAGTSHVCALLAAGTVRCWGGDFYRQLGGASTSASTTCDVFGEAVPCRPDAGRVEGLTGIKALAAGGATTCAVDGSGAVFCWGLDDAMQLGHARGGAGDVLCGTLPCNGTPQRVTGIPPMTSISVGLGFACAAGSEGLHCWGRNDVGQLGRGTISAPMPPGKPLVTSGTITALAARSHACAIIDAHVECWGSNDHEEAGQQEKTCRNDTLGCRPTPARVVLPPEAKAPRALGLTEGITCVVDVDGALFCRGGALFGGLGTGESGNTNVAMTRVTGMPPVRAITGGSSPLCVVAGDDAVFCWGASALGQLGTGPSIPRDCASAPCATRPRLIAGPKLRTAVGGADFVVAIDTAGALLGWGLNAVGQTGHAPKSGADASCSVPGASIPAPCAFDPTLATLAFH